MFLAAIFSNLGGRGMGVMPLLGQPGVCSHRLALPEATRSAHTVWADCAAPKLGQVPALDVPLMAPTAAMLAAWTAQPDLLTACVGEVCRLHALVEVWVPPGLDEVVLRVRHL